MPTRQELVKHWDVLVAYKEGKDIQYWDEDDGLWWDVLAPSFQSQIKYRVKPKKVQKSYWLNCYPRDTTYRSVSDLVVLYHSKEEADKYASPKRVACIEVKYEVEE